MPFIISTLVIIYSVFYTSFLDRTVNERRKQNRQEVSNSITTGLFVAFNNQQFLLEIVFILHFLIQSLVAVLIIIYFMFLHAEISKN
jgi:Na+/melibiose symporter-like transporter